MGSVVVAVFLTFFSVFFLEPGLFLNEFLDLHEKERPQLEEFLRKKGWSYTSVNAPRGSNFRYVGWQRRENKPNGLVNLYTRTYWSNGSLYKTMYSTNDPQEADAIKNRMRDQYQFLRKGTGVMEGVTYVEYANKEYSMRVTQPKVNEKTRWEFHLFKRPGLSTPEDTTKASRE